MKGKRILILLSLANVTVWIFLAFLLSRIEGGAESAYKCGKIFLFFLPPSSLSWRAKTTFCFTAFSCMSGVKRVRRDFVDGLWNASRNWKEEEWKSAARKYVSMYSWFNLSNLIIIQSTASWLNLRTPYTRPLRPESSHTQVNKCGLLETRFLSCLPFALL